MPISLPTYPGPVTADLTFYDAGIWQAPIGLGTAARIDLLGDCHGVAVTMPPMTAADARVWISRLNRGYAEEVRFEWQQPEMPAQAFGSVAKVRVAAAAQATQLDIFCDVAGIVFPEGRYFAVLEGGRYYLHSIAGADAISAGGKAVANIHPRLRRAISANAPIAWNPPIIDGVLQGDRNTWNISQARHVGLQFEIVENE